MASDNEQSVFKPYASGQGPNGRAGVSTTVPLGDNASLTAYAGLVSSQYTGVSPNAGLKADVRVPMAKNMSLDAYGVRDCSRFGCSTSGGAYLRAGAPVGKEGWLGGYGGADFRGGSAQPSFGVEFRMRF